MGNNLVKRAFSYPKEAKATHTDFSAEAEYMKQFTDADFQYSAAQFDTDYLEAISSQENADPSSLARESLFVKFDPLVGKSTPPGKVISKAPSKLNEIYEIDESTGLPEGLPEARNITSEPKCLSTDHNLLVMDTPPKATERVKKPDAPQHPLANSLVTPLDLDLTFPGHVPSASQPTNMYTEDQVATMMENARKEEIENARRKYAAEIAALERELSELDQKPGQLYDECMYVDSALTSQQELLEREIAICKRLLTEHEQLETLMVYCHEKFKEQFLSKAEQRDTMLKSEKFKVKSFEELLQRYLKLQEASKKLYKYGLSSLKNKSNESTEELRRFSEECLQNQDRLNLSSESVQKEISSKLAVERAQTKTIEMQVRSLQSALAQKEQEKQELTQIAEQLMKGLRNSG